MTRNLAVSLVLAVLGVVMLVLALTVDVTPVNAIVLGSGIVGVLWFGERHWARRP